MDVNGDGVIDLLSGSYSRHDEFMAGLFQVLPGKGKGEFGAVQVLQGSDGQPLILSVDEAAEDQDIQRICTRPTAVDLDGDGKLDIVAGNFGGTFAWFRGEGGGKFAPKSQPLPAEAGALVVPHHSDPWLVDWDGDGDLDLFSGSSEGSVFLAKNVGSRTAPKFAVPVVVVKLDHSGPSELDVFGDGHLKGPRGSTRVYVDDVDGDGKLDLLVGDCVVVMQVAAGVPEAEAKQKLAAWREKQQKFLAEDRGEMTEAKQREFQQQYEALEKEREAFARQIRTGFVWLFRQK